MVKKLIFIIGFLISICPLAFSQTRGYPNQILPYNYNLYQQISSQLIDADISFHSSFKPYLLDDSIFRNTIIFNNFSIKKDSSNFSWIYRKILNEHLIEVNKKEYSLYADFLPDFMVGYDKEKRATTWLNTRGYQFGGTVGSKFSFYTSGFENQGKFPTYLDNYINDNNLIPGQAYDRSFGKPVKDWSYSTALLSYTPSKFLNLILGHDKNFIGDGYRSMLLSDISGPYTYFKATATLGNLKYMALYTAMLEPMALKFSYDTGFRKKGGVFHYLDWNINKKITVGFFDAIIYSNADDEGNIRGFDWSYINPIIFLRPLEASSGSPDNALIGITSKYNVYKNLSLYGQFVFDEFEAKSFFSKTGSYRNKWGAQIGFKGFNPFNIKNLSYFAEYNLARPYTYSSRNLILSYSNYSQPLAHPFGANFKEVVFGSSYQYKKLFFWGRMNVAKYGLDQNNINNGKDIFKPYNTTSQTDGVFIGNGLKTNFYYLEGAASLIINPKTNLRVELSGVIRRESNIEFNYKTAWVSFGLRSSFRQFYNDF